MPSCVEETMTRVLTMEGGSESVWEDGCHACNNAKKEGATDRRMTLRQSEKRDLC